MTDLKLAAGPCIRMFSPRLIAPALDCTAPTLRHWHWHWRLETWEYLSRGCQCFVSDASPAFAWLRSTVSWSLA